MMGSWSKFFMGFARILISLLFIVGGILSIIHWDLAQTELAGAISNWDHYAGHIDSLNPVINGLSSWMTLYLIVGVSVQMIGGLALFLGMYVRTGAALLILICITEGVLYHHFWFFQGVNFAATGMLFLKQLAIIGGLLMVLIVGKGNSPMTKKSAHKDKDGQKKYDHEE